MQEYQYKAEHVQGKYNPADAPSRLVSAVDESLSDLALLHKYLETDELPAQPIDRRRIKRKVSNHFLRDGQLFRQDAKQVRKVLENSEERIQALTQLYDENGHPGINNTLSAINR